MNKTRNKIFVGCLALLLVMVAGYALFSQNLNITGTAKAQGNFSVTMTCTPGLTNEGFLNANYLGYAPKKDNNYANDSCTVNGNKVTYQAELKMPGAVRNFTIKMTNSGSMDAILNARKDVKLSSEICIGNYDTGEFNNCVTDDDGSDDTLYSIAFVGFETKDSKLILGTNDNAAELTKFVDLENGIITLKPGESMYYITAASLSDTYGAGAEDSNKMLIKQTLNQEFVFKQPTK